MQSVESKLAVWRSTKESEWAVEGSQLRLKHPTRSGKPHTAPCPKLSVLSSGTAMRPANSTYSPIL